MGSEWIYELSSFLYFTELFVDFLADIFCLSSQIHSQPPLLYDTDVWNIWNYITGLLSFLTLNWLWPSEVTAEEWTKVGCLLSNYPSGCITSLFCPLRPAASVLGLLQNSLWFHRPHTHFVNSHFVNKTL